MFFYMFIACTGIEYSVEKNYGNNRKGEVPESYVEALEGSVIERIKRLFNSVSLSFTPWHIPRENW